MAFQIENGVLKEYTEEQGVTEVVVPEDVKKIEDDAFSDCTLVTSITLPDGVTEIGSSAFENCSSLASMTIPGSVKEIGGNAFSGTPWLDNYPNDLVIVGDSIFIKYKGSDKSVTIPDGVKKIGGSAFEGCKYLTSITLPDSVTKIGDCAFYNCSSLTSITIPNSVTEIGDWAFEKCSLLTSITLPDSVTEIGEDAFSGTPWLDNYLNDLVIVGDSILIKYKGTEKSVTIPDVVKKIGGSAFYECSSLKSVTIPDGVTEIGFRAFYCCSSLTSITLPDSVTEIDGSAFVGCSSLTSIKLPDSVKKIGWSAFVSCSSLTSIIIPNSVTEIGESAFEDCNSLTSITLPNSVTEIGESAFEDCDSLTSITLPNSVSEIGYHAFKGCTSLTSITIPNSVTKIGEKAFYCCTSLTSITIPNSVMEIGESAFEYCTSLTSITLTNSVTKIGKSAFEDCESLTSITIPYGVTEIVDRAFYNCSSLKSITIPNSVTKIGKYAFFKCKSLTSITLPSNVTEIGYGAFEGCTSLEELTIFTFTVNNKLWNWDKVQPSDIKSMLDKNGYNVTMDHATKYMFVLQVLLNQDQPEAEAYVKKNFIKFAQFSIDRNRIDELRKYVELGFFTKTNIGKQILYAMDREKKNKEIILYLLSVKDSLGGFKLDEIDKYIELALNDVELTAAALEYKNKYFTSEQVEAIEADKIDKELGFKERTAAEWKKVFAYEVKDGEVTITAYKGSDLDVIVPDSICGKPVTAIGDMAFSSCKPRLKKEVKETLLKLKSVYIGENIKTFGDDILAGCLSLETLTAFDKTIEMSAFELGAYKGSPIKWIPLSIDLKTRTMLIIAEKPICDKPYNKEFIDVTWEKCTLRKWLNEDFYSSFTDEEKAKIAKTTVVNSDNKKYGTKGGNDTTDKIFLLSIDEAEKLFANDATRAVGSWWWLRSPGCFQDYAASVYDSGLLIHDGSYVRHESGVRPALNLKF